MKNFKTKTVQAVAWVALSKSLSQIISFGYGIVLARLLFPEDFGLVAMVAVIIGIAGLLADTGFGQALIQKQNTTEIHYSSVFWLNITIALLLSIVVFSAADLISLFYDRPELTNLAQVISISFVIGALGFIPRILLTKKLNFKIISLAEIFAMVVSGVVAVVCAMQGFGYWSLVIHQLLQQLIMTIVLCVAVRWLPKFIIDFKAIKELFSFSASVFGTQVLQYAANNTDKIILGKYLGAASLGVYDKAQSMMLFPLVTISRSVGSVMFPSLSLIQDDRARVRGVYLRSISAIALLSFPMMMGMFVVADAFVYGVLGEHWAEIIPILQVFCIAGIFTSIVTVTGGVYQSQGAAGLQFRVNMVTQPLRIVCIVVGLYWGLPGVVIGFTVATILNTLITLTFAGRLIDLNLAKFFITLLPIALPSLIMAIFIYSLDSYILPPMSSLLSFLVQVMAGVLVYWLLLIVLKVTAYKDVAHVLKSEIKRR